MLSYIHRHPGERAGIVDTALCVETEGRGFQSLFHTFMHSKHQKSYVFIIIIL